MFGLTGSSIFDYGPAHAHGLGGSSHAWRIDGADQDAGTGYYVSNGNYVNLVANARVPALEVANLSLVALVVPGSPVSGNSAALFAYNATYSGYQLTAAENSGTTTLDFLVSTTGHSDNNLNVTGIPENQLALAVARYDGKAKNLSVYGLSGSLVGAASGAPYATGPISYVNACNGRFGAAAGYTNATIYGLLLYNRDIGQELASLFGEEGTSGIALPFIPRRRVFQSFGPSTTHSGAASNIVSLADSASRLALFGRSASSTLVLSDKAGTARLHAVAAVSSLVLADSASGAKPTARVLPLSAASILVLSDSAAKYTARVIPVSASSTMSLYDALVRSNSVLSASNLSLVDFARASRIIPLSDSITLYDSASRLLKAGRSASSIITLQQSVTFSLIRASSLEQYCPFVGEGGSGAPTPPPTTLAGPIPGIQAQFQLVYPAAGTTTACVSLRAPNLGNKDRLTFNRVLRETRGGTLLVFADPIWPKIERLVLNFSGLWQNEAQDLLAFFANYLGLEVGLLDWEQRYWTGIILTPEHPVIEDSFNRYSASFEFEGSLSSINPLVVPEVPTVIDPRMSTNNRSRINPLELPPFTAVGSVKA
jgi:hypothetical protein